MVLPIQSYVLTAEQRKVVFRAAEHIADVCMTAQGFKSGLLSDYQTSTVLDNLVFRRYAGVYDERTAEKYGYHLPGQTDDSPSTGRDLDQAAMTAMYGKFGEGSAREDVDVAAGKLTYGGCMGKAEAQLAKGTRFIVGIGQGYAEPVRELSLDTKPASNVKVLAAQRRWAACMAESGYQMKATVAENPSMKTLDLDTPRPTAAEIEMARADVKCQKRTNVVRTWYEAEVAYERRVIDKHAEEFADIRKDNDTLIQRAAKLLGESAP